jgi:pyruvate/2-oxoglutarate dehydrogenase complex dihydrolipoamide acyltransferase (E2) component
MAEIKLPELGEGVEKVNVSFWHYDVDENIKEGEDLLEVTTDKASFNVPATVAGILKEQKFEEGEEIAIGDVIAIIE